MLFHLEISGILPVQLQLGLQSSPQYYHYRQLISPLSLKVRVLWFYLKYMKYVLIVFFSFKTTRIQGDTGKSLSEALLFSEHGEKMLCTKIVLIVRHNFCTYTGSPQV